MLFGFFIMGFCDVVGISTSYVKADFGLSETIAGFLPSMVFLWFLLWFVCLVLGGVLVGELRRDEELVAGEAAGLEGGAHGAFVAVGGGGVERPVAGRKSVFHGLLTFLRILHLIDPEDGGGHHAAVGQTYGFHADGHFPTPESNGFAERPSGVRSPLKRSFVE